MDDRELFIAAIAGTAVIFLLISFILSQMLLVQRRRQHHLREIKLLERQYNEEILKTRLEIQEETFRAISQEVHDNIGQMLSLAKLHLNTLDTPSGNRDQKLEDARGLIARSIFGLRDLSKSLNADSIEAMGLAKALELEVQRLQKSGLLQAGLVLEGTVQKLDPRKELVLFRIAQETLQNIIKHADASHVTVILDYRKPLLEMVIADDGKGFVQNAVGSEGAGLRNIRTRAALIGCILVLESATGKGTKLHLKLPVNT